MVQLKPALVKSLRPLSKVAFGQDLRLALCLAIGREPSPTFAQSDIPEWLHVTSYSHVERPMESLQRIGAIELAETTSRGKMWSRNGSLVWSYAEELVKSFLERPSTDRLF